MTSRQTLTACLAILLVTGVSLGPDEEYAAAQGRTEVDAAMEVLARGPVHEAFAPTVTYDPEPGIVVPRPPPPPIEELAPEQQPAGDYVDWIPGYWAWDDDREDFLWVSGLWRNLPPGRQWVSGYWAHLGRGAQWISGYWADARLTEVEYLPEPPESVEYGPNVAAPSADYTWLPGCWLWQQNRYAWRPGFWSLVRPNWVWIPAHHLWSPRGYVYVDGYWDHAIERRGMLFAPVSFNQDMYSQRGFSYSPTTVIDLAVFANHLFVRPHYGHYYFGDYYGANYNNVGFLPAFSFHSGRFGYDPIYAHQRWNNRQDRDWERGVQETFQHRREDERARPPRTFAAQQELVRQGLSEQNAGRVFTQPLKQFTQSSDATARFQSVNDEHRQRLAQRAKEIRTQREEREKLETKDVDPTASSPDRTPEPSRARLPRSPFVAKDANELGKDVGPPRTQEFPKPDPGVTPRPRRPGFPSEAPRRDARPESDRAKPAVESKPEPQSERPRRPGSPSEAPKPGQRPVPARGKPTPGPQPTPADEPQSETKPAPKPATKSEPKSEPKAEPQSEPKPARKVERSPERSQPKPGNRPNRGTKDLPKS